MTLTRSTTCFLIAARRASRARCSSSIWVSSFTNLSSDILFSEKMGKSLVGTNNTKFNLKSNIWLEKKVIQTRVRSDCLDISRKRILWCNGMKNSYWAGFVSKNTKIKAEDGAENRKRLNYCELQKDSIWSTWPNECLMPRCVWLKVPFALIIYVVTAAQQDLAGVLALKARLFVPQLHTIS